MERKVAKELIHIRDWLATAATIVERGEATYLEDPVLHEAGDSLMMKLGEEEVTAPAGVDWADAIDNRNFLIHVYDQIRRDLTWRTLADDLPAWRTALQALITEAEQALGLSASS